MPKLLYTIEKFVVEIFAKNPSPVIRAIFKQTILHENSPNQELPNNLEEFRLATEVASQLVTIIDPVTQQTITISIAGLQAAIGQGLYSWLNYMNGELTNEGYLVNGSTSKNN